MPDAAGPSIAIRTPCPAISPEHCVETHYRVGSVKHADEEIGPEEAVPRVGRFVGKVELRRQHGAVRSLEAHMEVTRASGIQPRQDGLEDVAALGVRELMPA